MPNLDNTGPDGMGPTGRGQGSCPNKEKICTAQLGRGVGRGRSRRCRGGRGFGAGRGRGVPFGMGGVSYEEQDKKTFLESKIRFLEEQLVSMKSRLSEVQE